MSEELDWPRVSVVRSCAGPALLVAGLLAGAAHRLQAHGTEARYVELVQWKKEHFSKVFGTGTSALGVPGSRNSLQLRMIENKACVHRQRRRLRRRRCLCLRCRRAGDAAVTYAPALSTPFVVGWDKNGGTGVGVTEPIKPEPGAVLQTVTLTLDRARLAGQGTQGSDIAIGSRMGFALCDVAVTRSGTTDAASGVRPGAADGERCAGRGAIVPARVGIYDATGRAPLASDRALMLQRYADDLRMLRGQRPHVLAVGESPGVLCRRQLRRAVAGGHLRAGGDARPRVSGLSRHLRSAARTRPAP